MDSFTSFALDRESLVSLDKLLISFSRSESKSGSESEFSVVFSDFLSAVCLVVLFDFFSSGTSSGPVERSLMSSIILKKVYNGYLYNLSADSTNCEL